MREKIKLSGVPETMLQTVYARAKESRGRGAIHDAKAEEIIEKLDYDFSLADKDTAMHSGVCYRGALPVTEEMAKTYHVVLVAYDGFNPDGLPGRGPFCAAPPGCRPAQGRGRAALPWGLQSRTESNWSAG